MSSTHWPVRGEPRTVLKLFSSEQPAEADDGEVSPQSTLRQLYERAFVPLWIEGQALSPKTSQLYLDALDWWERLTGNPPLSQIDDFTTSRFVAQLLQQKGRKSKTLSIATVRKHCTQIDKLLAFAGPRTRDKCGRKNRELIAFPPVVEKPRADYQPPDGDFTLAELRSIYAACDKLKNPQVDGVAPGDWWRAFCVTAYYTGLRVGQLMRLEWADLQPPTIAVWASASKGRRGKRQYLTAETLAHWQRIRTPRRLVFEFPKWEQNPRWHHDLWKRLLTHAGLSHERQFGFHGLRKLHATQLAELELAAGDPLQAAQQSLGHTSKGTTSGFYVNGRTQERILAALLERLPSPLPTPLPPSRAS